MLPIFGDGLQNGGLDYWWCNQYLGDEQKKILRGQDIGGAINILERENQNGFR